MGFSFSSNNDYVVVQVPLKAGEGLSNAQYNADLLEDLLQGAEDGRLFKVGLGEFHFSRPIESLESAEVNLEGNSYVGTKLIWRNDVTGGTPALNLKGQSCSVRRLAIQYGDGTLRADGRNVEGLRLARAVNGSGSLSIGYNDLTGVRIRGFSGRPLDIQQAIQTDISNIVVSGNNLPALVRNSQESGGKESTTLNISNSYFQTSSTSGLDLENVTDTKLTLCKFEECGTVVEPLFSQSANPTPASVNGVADLPHAGLRGFNLKRVVLDSCYWELNKREWAFIDSDVMLLTPQLNRRAIVADLSSTFREVISVANPTNSTDYNTLFAGRFGRRLDIVYWDSTNRVAYDYSTAGGGTYTARSSTRPAYYAGKVNFPSTGTNDGRTYYAVATHTAYYWNGSAYVPVWDSSYFNNHGSALENRGFTIFTNLEVRRYGRNYSPRTPFGNVSITDTNTDFSGEGSPEGVWSRNKGSVYVDTLTGERYIKGSDGGSTTGWVLDKLSSNLVKSDVGLGNVDNTSDLNKPVSTATLIELRRTGVVGKRNAFIMHPSITGASILGLGGTIAGGGTTAQAFASASPTLASERFNRTTLTTSSSAGTSANYRGSTNVGYNLTIGFKTELNFTSGASILGGQENYVGMSSNTTTPSALSNLTDFLGMIKESGDTNWFFAKQTGSGAFTKVDLGVAVTAGQVFQLELIALPQNAGVNVRIVQTNLDGSQTVVYEVVHTTGLADASTILYPHVAVRNGATAATATFGFISGYVFAL